MRMHLAGYWDARRESVDACAERLAGFMSAVQDRHPLLSTWFEKGGSKREALESKVDVTVESLREQLLEGRHRKDSPDHEVMEDLGFTFAVWNGREPSASLSTHCGSYSKRGSNNCLLRLPTMESAASLYSRATVHALVTDLVHWWEPEYATFVNQDLADAQDQPSYAAAGWMTYLGPEMASQVGAELSDFETEGLSSGGVLITLGDDPAAVTDDDVVALRRRLEPAMRLLD